MSYYVVIRAAAAAAWEDGGINDQPRLVDHAAFMDELAKQGQLLFAGPLAGSEAGRLRALLIFNADSEAEIHRRLGDDPWSDRLQITSIETWNVLVGTQRLASADATARTRA